MFPSIYSLNFLYLVLKRSEDFIKKNHLHKTCGNHVKPKNVRNAKLIFLFIKALIIQLNPVYNLSCIVGKTVFSWDHFSGWINFWLRITNVMSVLHKYFHHVSLCVSWQPNRKIGFKWVYHPSFMPVGLKPCVYVNVYCMTLCISILTV